MAAILFVYLSKDFPAFFIWCTPDGSTGGGHLGLFWRLAQWITRGHAEKTCLFQAMNNQMNTDKDISYYFTNSLDTLNVI